MTTENIRMLYAHYQKMAKEGNPLYGAKLQSAIKTRGAMNAKELEIARPYLLEKPQEKPDGKKPKG